MDSLNPQLKTPLLLGEGTQDNPSLEAIALAEQIILNSNVIQAPTAADEVLQKFITEAAGKIEHYVDEMFNSMFEKGEID